MKGFKKYISAALLAVLCLLFLAACSCNQGLPKLATPELQINGTVLTWNAVKNAKGYFVDIDGESHSVDVCSYDLAGLITLNTCQIKVMAKGNSTDYIDSDWSAVQSYAPYRTSDNLWLNLTFPDGESRNYIKFNGMHGGFNKEVFYYDSVINLVPTKKCITRITEDVYYMYEWKAVEGDTFRWVKTGSTMDKKTAGSEAYKLFNIIFSGKTDGEAVSESVNVDGADILCKKYSQTGNDGTSCYWRPNGYDFWIKCSSFDLSGEPYEIYAEKLDMEFTSLPGFIDLP